MNNADKPAMPVSVSQGVQGDFMTTDDYGVGMGLSKREHFAAMAMAAMLSNPKEWMIMSSDLSISALEAADALLKELAK